MDKKLGRVCKGLAAFLALSSEAHAGSFSVSPVRITLSAKEAVAALTVRNEGTEPTVVQLEVFNWSQVDGANTLTATSEVLATPPILTISPGGSRIMRVGLRRAPDQQHELTYRLTLREVPPPQPLAQGLRVALLVSLPVFVDPPHPVAPEMHWSATRIADGSIRVQAQNSGTAHIQLGRMDLLGPDGAPPIASRDGSEYVLPGNVREWILKPTSPVAAGATVRISSQTDAGKIVSAVTLNDLAHASAPAVAVAASR